MWHKEMEETKEATEEVAGDAVVMTALQRKVHTRLASFDPCVRSDGGSREATGSEFKGAG